MTKQNKSSHTDFKCQQTFADNAVKSLKLRQRFNVGHGDIGITCACDLKNRRDLSNEAINRMIDILPAMRWTKMPKTSLTRIIRLQVVAGSYCGVATRKKMSKDSEEKLKKLIYNQNSWNLFKLQGLCNWKLVRQISCVEQDRLAFFSQSPNPRASRSFSATRTTNS